ncbi:MAG: hypothetical protein AAF363_19440 [Bacteroidota bacterium]
MRQHFKYWIAVLSLILCIKGSNAFCTEFKIGLKGNGVLITSKGQYDKPELISVERGETSYNFIKLECKKVLLDQKLAWKDSDPLQGFNFYKLIYRKADGTVEQQIQGIYVPFEKPEILLAVARCPLAKCSLNLSILNLESGELLNGSLEAFDRHGRLVRRRRIGVTVDNPSVKFQIGKRNRVHLLVLKNEHNEIIASKIIKV